MALYYSCLAIVTLLENQAGSNVMLKIDVPAEQADNPYAFAAQNHAKEIMAAAAAFSQAVYTHSKLSLREFEAGRALIADINGCLICQKFRAARDVQSIVSGLGIRPDQTVVGNGPAPDEAFYAAVKDWRNSDMFNERERLVLEYAERFATVPKELAADHAFWAKMKAQFSDAEIVDLAHCVAAWMGLGRTAHVLGFDSVCTPFISASAN